MKKIICISKNLIPRNLKEDTTYFTTYSNSGKDHIGFFGATLIKDVQKAGLRPSEKIWDFCTIALSVAAADNSQIRRKSPDGWTRQMDLTIHLCNPTTWEPVREELEKTLKFLTGDFWFLTFKDGGVNPPQAKLQKQFNCDCVSLLSGGVDSLVGAIDLVTDHHIPIFVSQIVKGDSKTQKYYAEKISPTSSHLQWSHKIHVPKGKSEGSTRGRSIIFLAFAALAASGLEPKHDKPINIFVPENGFISLNIPLNSGRMGSFSTKTTHPIYLSGIQNIWDKLNFNFKLVTPYKFKTKGELLSQCKNQVMLRELIIKSTSCGKFSRHGLQHCGRCVPCMVRRAAFLAARMRDKTVYKFAALAKSGLNHGPNDVGAMANACITSKQPNGIQRLISGNLYFAAHLERKYFEGVVTRSLKEIELLLKKQKVI